MTSRTDLTHIRLVQVRDTGKTLVWDVTAKDGGLRLGEVKWFGRWRRYAFFPSDCVFEHQCLRELADFLEARTREHAASKRKDRP
jgi:hypothetical protein